MIVSTTVEVAANIAVEDPQRGVLVVPGGVIARWWIGWRFGVADLAGVRVLHHEVQVLPWSLGAYLPSYDGVTEFPADLDVWEPPRELTIEAFNLEDTYSHTVWVAASVERTEVWARLFQTIVDALEWSRYA